MARLNVNPTRMQLKTLKNRLKIAVRGHKLLKDKTDEMIRRFSVLVKQNYALRVETEDEIRNLLKQFCVSKAYLSSQEVLSMFAFPVSSFTPNFNEKSVMNVPTPDIELVENTSTEMPYSFVNSSAEMDILVQKIKDIMPKVMKLASVEKTCQVLAGEIERTKRRVNALEFVMIPQLNETIKYIAMKIEENDRASRIRLIKVKSMIEERNS